MKRKGYVHVYTGDGKGKTTAAMGLAMRALGNGRKVNVVQFLKGRKSGELNLEHPNFSYKQFGTSSFVYGKPSSNDILLGKNAISYIKDIIKNKIPDVLILDEIIDAMDCGIITESDILNIIKNKPKSTEIILTGHSLPDSILEQSDLVTEMKKVKHYFDKGISARKGIEF